MMVGSRVFVDDEAHHGADAANFLAPSCWTLSRQKAGRSDGSRAVTPSSRRRYSETRSSVSSKPSALPIHALMFPQPTIVPRASSGNWVHPQGHSDGTPGSQALGIFPLESLDGPSFSLRPVGDRLAKWKRSAAAREAGERR